MASNHTDQNCDQETILQQIEHDIQFPMKFDTRWSCNSFAKVETKYLSPGVIMPGTSFQLSISLTDKENCEQYSGIHITSNEFEPNTRVYLEVLITKIDGSTIKSKMDWEFKGYAGISRLYENDLTTTHNSLKINITVYK